MPQHGEGYIIHVPVKAISLDELPKARSRKTSPIKKTRDWKATLERIAAMDFELLRIDFSPETLSLGSSVPDRFKRMLAAEIKTLGLDSKLRLTFRGVTTGNPILYIVRRDKQMRLFSSTPSKRRRQQTAEPTVAPEKNTRGKTNSRRSRSE